METDTQEEMVRFKHLRTQTLARRLSSCRSSLLSPPEVWQLETFITQNRILLTLKSAETAFSPLDIHTFAPCSEQEFSIIS